MIHHQRLKTELQVRYQRLHNSTHQAYAAEAAYFLDYIQKNPTLKHLFDAIESSEEGTNFEEWVKSNTARRGQYEWPDTEQQRAKIAWSIFKNIATKQTPSMTWALVFSNATNINHSHHELTERAFSPLINYVQDKLSDSSDILHLLERYARRVEWFEQKRLLKSYMEDTAHGEAIYDMDLRRFLFDQGVEHPFSGANSPSGRADIVAELSGDDPLICEVKLYDGKSYGAAYLAKGFKQAVRYAKDYRKPFGHLVVFNLSENSLVIDSDDNKDAWPPRIDLGEHTLFIITIQAMPLAPASTRGKLEPRRITREDLLGAEAVLD